MEICSFIWEINLVLYIYLFILHFLRGYRDEAGLRLLVFKIPTSNYVWNQNDQTLIGISKVLFLFLVWTMLDNDQSKCSTYEQVSNYKSLQT